MFFFKQKTAYEMRISDWSSDVCSSDLAAFAETAKLALRHLDLIQGDEPLEEGSEDGGDDEQAEAEEAPDQQDSEDGGSGESQVDARAEMDGEQADDGDTDPDEQEMEADGEPEMGGEGDEGKSGRAHVGTPVTNGA